MITVNNITQELARLQNEILTKKPNMKNLIKILSLLTVIGFMLTSCEGPMGPAGNDGKDGRDGIDANTVCLVCHNTPNQDAKEAQYHLSKHYYGTTSARNTKWCARCHTSQGFIEITGNGKFIVSNDIPNATRITCETCHAHTTFEFAGDTVSQILRTTTPILLNYDKNLIATDFGSIDNLCVTCHQIRGVASATTTLPFFPMDYSQAPTADVQFRQGQSFAVHDGNQSNLFTGINGYEYAGQTYTRTWKHSTNSCTDCHMNDYNPADSTGGHTLKPNLAACTTCHSGSDKLTPIQTTITAKLTELANLLVARKVFKSALVHGTPGFVAVESNDYNGLLYDGTTTTVYTSIAANTTVSASTGLVVYGTKLTTAADDAATAATRIGRPWKWGELGAAYNYDYIKSELSLGVHNPTYALQLLQKSIDWINSN